MASTITTGSQGLAMTSMRRCEYYLFI